MRQADRQANKRAAADNKFTASSSLLLLLFCSFSFFLCLPPPPPPPFFFSFFFSFCLSFFLCFLLLCFYASFRSVSCSFRKRPPCRSGSAPRVPTADLDLGPSTLTSGYQGYCITIGRHTPVRRPAANGTTGRHAHTHPTGPPATETATHLRNVIPVFSARGRKKRRRSES